MANGFGDHLYRVKEHYRIKKERCSGCDAFRAMSAHIYAAKPIKNFCYVSMGSAVGVCLRSI